MESLLFHGILTEPRGRCHKRGWQPCCSEIPSVVPLRPASPGSLAKEGSIFNPPGAAAGGQRGHTRAFNPMRQSFLRLSETDFTGLLRTRIPTPRRRKRKRRERMKIGNCPQNSVMKIGNCPQNSVSPKLRGRQARRDRLLHYLVCRSRATARRGDTPRTLRRPVVRRRLFAVGRKRDYTLIHD